MERPRMGRSLGLGGLRSGPVPGGGASATCWGEIHGLFCQGTSPFLLGRAQARGHGDIPRYWSQQAVLWALRWIDDSLLTKPAIPTRNELFSQNQPCHCHFFGEPCLQFRLSRLVSVLDSMDRSFRLRRKRLLLSFPSQTPPIRGAPMSFLWMEYPILIQYLRLPSALKL